MTAVSWPRPLWPPRVDRRVNEQGPELRQCVGKTGWPTEAAAESSRATRWRDYYKLKVYQCGLCGLWHLGHKR